MLDSIRWRILLVALTGWVNRRQLEVIAYLREENRVLKEHLGGQRLHFTDPQRLYRRLIARKWTTARRRVGRPGVLQEIRALTVRMARENPTSGYRRIQGALKNLGQARFLKTPLFDQPNTLLNQ
jgi:hypothetical protein